MPETNAKKAARARTELKSFLEEKEVASYAEIREFLDDAGFAIDGVAVSIAMFGAGARVIADRGAPRTLENRRYKLKLKVTAITS